MDTASQILEELGALGNEADVVGMRRFGISGRQVLGISVTELRRIAKRYGRDHELARRLWSSGIHEARILASMIDEADKVTAQQMDDWAAEFDSWDLCDQCCANLFRDTPFVAAKVRSWSERDEEYVKRAAFALIAATATRRSQSPDGMFLDWLPLIDEGASDDRNFVKKSVSWALRQIGKRNLFLHGHAVALARELVESPPGPRRWIGRDALRELTSPQVPDRMESQ